MRVDMVSCARVLLIVCLVALMMVLSLAGCDGRPHKHAKFEEGQMVTIRVSGNSGMVIRVCTGPEYVRYTVKEYYETFKVGYYRHNSYKEFELEPKGGEQ